MRVKTVLPIGPLCLLTIACSPSSGEDVVIEVNDEVTLACTLLIPDSEAPLPAVILIPGGGPHTRDVDVFGFRFRDHFFDKLSYDCLAILSQGFVSIPDRGNVRSK